jgi:hypothetical protein
MSKPTIYSLLAKQGIDEITQTQLNTATSNSDVDEASIAFWKGPLTLSRVLEVRTYPHGLAIPELGTVAAQATAAETTVTFRPTGTELWAVMGIQILAGAGTPTINVSLSDADANLVLVHSGSSSTSASSFFPWESPLIISNSLFLSIYNSDATNAVNTSIAYHKVGL